MPSNPARRGKSWALVALLFSAYPAVAPAQPVPVRHLEGTLHGFLTLRSEDGRFLGTGEVIQVVSGIRVTTTSVFRFQDGSLDEETTVFSQRRKFQLISDRHVQKGPYFPHPTDLAIDCRSSLVTVRSVGKDGKEQVTERHIGLPPDLANGMVPAVLANIRPGAGETTVSMVVATPRPRIVKLVVTLRGEAPFSVNGAPFKANHYSIKIELGGIAGIVAPAIGKQPPDIQIWMTGGQAATLLREQGPLYAEGPITEIELTSAVWPEQGKSGTKSGN